jgi:hypothetical protein
MGLIYRKRYYLTHPWEIWDNVGSFRTKLMAAYQRARYGWAAWDIAGLGFSHTMVPAIGHSLVWLGKNFHGAPNGYGADNEGKPWHEWETNFDAWGNDLLKYGNALVEVAEDLPFPGSTDLSALEAYRAEEKRRDDAAREALHWVSDHYMSLWD